MDQLISFKISLNIYVCVFSIQWGLVLDQNL